MNERELNERHRSYNQRLNALEAEQAEAQRALAALAARIAAVEKEMLCRQGPGPRRVGRLRQLKRF